MRASPHAPLILLGELPPQPGESMKLLYDFGDSWLFTIKLERVESPGAKVKAPRILESHGTAPAQYPDWEG
ncbi:MAG: IS1096 element passenger TnpR family protein [Isosphaeraceae bacterium]